MSGEFSTGILSQPVSGESKYRNFESSGRLVSTGILSQHVSGGSKYRNSESTCVRGKFFFF